MINEVIIALSLIPANGNQAQAIQSQYGTILYQISGIYVCFAILVLKD